MESESFSGWRTMTETSAPACRSCCNACLPMFPVGVVITIDISLLLRKGRANWQFALTPSCGLSGRLGKLPVCPTLAPRFSFSLGAATGMMAPQKNSHAVTNKFVTTWRVASSAILSTNEGENIITWAEFLCEIRSILCQIVQIEFAMDALTEVLN